MFANLFDTLIVKLAGGFPEKLRLMGWEPVVSLIEPHIESHTIFLETMNGEFVIPHQLSEDQEVISVIVAYVKEGVNPWDTEVPAKYMAEKLSRIIGRELPYLVSRPLNADVAYYVCIRT